MTDKEMSLRSILFLVIGILLLLSLVICIYIVNSEKDLLSIEAEVIDVKKDSDGTGKNDVFVSYRVNNTFYQYNFYYKDDINIGDTIRIYYHEDNVTSVHTNKTSKFIFICPIVGLLLCIVGLFEIFKKNKERHDDISYETKVISVVGDTQQLAIIPSVEEAVTYIKTPEEEKEVSVKSLLKENQPYEELDTLEDREIEETKEKEVELPKEIIKMIPNYYYVSGNALVFEVMGQEVKEIDLKEVLRITKTINSAGELVKVSIFTPRMHCVLTNMKNVSLFEVSNLLHNKILGFNPSFQEQIEYKEY